MTHPLKPTAVFRDPLFHFLLIGLALFLFYGRVSTETSDSRRIEVSRAQIDALAREFQSTWSRPPSTEELSGLITSYIHDEVLYREGVAMGLVADDPVIKRRVRQKLEVMSEESNAMVAPGDAELAAYLARHADTFRPPMVVSFEQVFFSADAPAAEVEAKTTQALAALRAGAPAASVGQPTLLPASQTRAPMDAVARDFGAAFAKPLATLPLATWQGPIRSTFGMHLVRVSERTTAAAPSLSDVRPQVVREWENDRRERNRREAYRAMAANYHIVIDGKPAPAGTVP